MLFDILDYQANPYAQIRGVYAGSVQTGSLAFLTGSGGTPTEVVRISNTGNVGVATTTPWAKLSVTNTGTGPSFVVEDSTSPDTTPFIIDASGNVGIGDAAPSGKLGILTGTADDVTALAFSESTGSFGFAFKTDYVSTGDNNHLRLASFSNSDVMTWTLGGNVGVATTSPWRKLSVTGTVGFDGLTSSTGAGSLCLDSNKQVVYNSASDNCLSSTRATKHDIGILELDSLSLVEILQPVSFVYNDGDGRTRYGFIAEDTAAVDAHLATYDANSTVSGIDDRSILAVLVGAIKELAATVRGFAETFTTSELTFDRARGEELTVNKLCVGTTCVTEEQFQAVFGNQPAPAAQGSAGAPVANEEAPASSTTPGDGDTEPTTTSTAPLDSSAPGEALSPANDNRQPEGAEQSSHDGTEPAATEDPPTPTATEPAIEEEEESVGEENPPVVSEPANDNLPEQLEEAI